MSDWNAASVSIRVKRRHEAALKRDWLHATPHHRSQSFKKQKSSPKKMPQIYKKVLITKKNCAGQCGSTAMALIQLLRTLCARWDTPTVQWFRRVPFARQPRHPWTPLMSAEQILAGLVAGRVLVTYLGCSGLPVQHINIPYVTLQVSGVNDYRKAHTRWLGTVELDSWSRGRGFDSDRGVIRATTLGKLFTTNVPLFTKQYTFVPCEGFHANAP